VLLLIEGSLAGEFVAELERYWMQLTSCELTIDLSDVFTTDRDGRRLLRRMHESGVRFRGARLAIRDVMDEIAKTNS
jgi:hypothetical protein